MSDETRGRRMHQWRYDHDLTQPEAADLLGVHVSTWARWEADRGQPRDPGAVEALLAKAPPADPSSPSTFDPRLLRAWRAYTRTSHAELAERLGVSPHMPGRWERGVHVPSRENWSRLRQVMGGFTIIFETEHTS